MRRHTRGEYIIAMTIGSKVSPSEYEDLYYVEPCTCGDEQNCPGWKSVVMHDK